MKQKSGTQWFRFTLGNSATFVAARFRWGKSIFAMVGLSVAIARKLRKFESGLRTFLILIAALFFYCPAQAHYGKVLGAATVSATLDGNPVSAQFAGVDSDGRWRANLGLTPGSHTLKLAANHPSGQYTAYATNTFTITNRFVLSRQGRVWSAGGIYR